jgi:uncharacterized protein
VKRTVVICTALAVGVAAGGISLYMSRLPERQVAITAKQATLEGTMYGNVTGPTIVVLHGSGPDGRENAYYKLLARTFAKAGWATLVYDKRGCGLSSGNWIEEPFQQLIDDAVTVVDHVKTLPGVDPNRIAIWGGSEGGSIAPEVAVRTAACGVISQSASGVPFWMQNRYQKTLELQRAGLSASEIAKEMVVHEAAMNYARTGKGWERFETLRSRGSRLGILNDRNDVWWKWYGSKLDYEPGRWLRQLKVPVLAVWGDADVLVPVAESRQAFRTAILNQNSLTSVVFGGADHGLSVNQQPMQLELFEKWLRELASE